MESERVRLRKSRRFWILLTALIFLAFNALFLISFYVIVPYFANKLIYNVNVQVEFLLTEVGFSNLTRDGFDITLNGRVFLTAPVDLQFAFPQGVNIYTFYIPQDLQPPLAPRAQEDLATGEGMADPAHRGTRRALSSSRPTLLQTERCKYDTLYKDYTWFDTNYYKDVSNSVELFGNAKVRDVQANPRTGDVLVYSSFTVDNEEAFEEFCQYLLHGFRIPWQFRGPLDVHLGKLAVKNLDFNRLVMVGGPGLMSDPEILGASADKFLRRTGDPREFFQVTKITILNDKVTDRIIPFEAEAAVSNWELLTIDNVGSAGFSLRFNNIPVATVHLEELPFQRGINVLKMRGEFDGHNPQLPELLSSILSNEPAEISLVSTTQKADPIFADFDYENVFGPALSTFAVTTALGPGDVPESALFGFEMKNAHLNAHHPAPAGQAVGEEGVKKIEFVSPIPAFPSKAMKRKHTLAERMERREQRAVVRRLKDETKEFRRREKEQRKQDRALQKQLKAEQKILDKREKRRRKMFPGLTEEEIEGLRIILDETPRKRQLQSDNDQVSPTAETSAPESWGQVRRKGERKLNMEVMSGPEGKYVRDPEGMSWKRMFVTVMEPFFTRNLQERQVASSAEPAGLPVIRDWVVGSGFGDLAMQVLHNVVGLADTFVRPRNPEGSPPSIPSPVNPSSVKAPVLNSAAIDSAAMDSAAMDSAAMDSAAMDSAAVTLAGMKSAEGFESENLEAELSAGEVALHATQMAEAALREAALKAGPIREAALREAALHEKRGHPGETDHPGETGHVGESGYGGQSESGQAAADVERIFKGVKLIMDKFASSGLFANLANGITNTAVEALTLRAGDEPMLKHNDLHLDDNRFIRIYPPGAPPHPPAPAAESLEENVDDSEVSASAARRRPRETVEWLDYSGYYREGVTWKERDVNLADVLPLAPLRLEGELGIGLWHPFSSLDLLKTNLSAQPYLTSDWCSKCKVGTFSAGMSAVELQNFQETIDLIDAMPPGFVLHGFKRHGIVDGQSDIKKFDFNAEFAFDPESAPDLRNILETLITKFETNQPSLDAGFEHGELIANVKINHKLDIPINARNLSSHVQLPIPELPEFKVVSMEIGETDDVTILMRLAIESPVPVTFTVGPIFLDWFYEGVRMGPITIPELTIHEGVNIIDAYGGAYMRPTLLVKGTSLFSAAMTAEYLNVCIGPRQMYSPQEKLAMNKNNGTDLAPTIDRFLHNHITLVCASAPNPMRDKAGGKPGEIFNILGAVLGLNDADDLDKPTNASVAQQRDTQHVPISTNQNHKRDNNAIAQSGG